MRLLLCLLLLLTVPALPGTAAQAPRRPSPALAQEIAAVRRAGLPVTPHQMHRPSLPSRDNAAPLYRLLMQRFKAVPRVDRDAIGDLGRAPTPAQVDAARLALARNAATLALLHRAADRLRCAFPRDWSLGPSLLFPELSPLREAARWTRAESAVLLQQGRPQEAVRAQARGFRIAHHAASDDTLIAHLVGIAVRNVTLNGLEQILSRSGTNASIADAVRRAVEQASPASRLSASLRGDMVLGMVTLDMVRRGGPSTLAEMAGETGGSGAPAPRIRRPQNWDRLVDDNAVLYLQTMRAVAAVIDRPVPAARPAVRRIMDMAESRAERDPRLALIAILLPVYQNPVEARGRSEAAQQVVRAAAAALAYRARHGTFPARLKQALSPVPTDPFDGRPLRYQREGAGFVVWSVGPTGRFDGGRPDVKPASAETLFRYPPPEDRK